MMDVGRRSLMNSQTALQTTAHNVANKSTEGYSRQRVEMVRFGTGAFEQSLRRNIAGPAAAQRSRNPIAGRALGAVGAETTENEMRDEAGDLDRAVQTDGAPLGTVRVSGQVPVR